MRRFPLERAAALLSALALFPVQARSQSPDPSGAPVEAPVLALPTIGSAAEDRARLGHLLGDTTGTTGFLLRSPSSQLRSRTSGVEWSIISPELLVQWNSDIPYSLNDGALWAGRGISTQLMFGAAARVGRLSLVLAPQVAASQNAEFALLPDSLTRLNPERSDYVPPWWKTWLGADIPLRFGDRPYALIDPGQSSLTLDLGRIAVGTATENQWWGPGIRSALVMSNHAAGVPHLFLRTGRPLRTAAGELEARWMVGGLTESVFFDTISTNSLRSLSASSLALRPRPLPNLTLGAARAVYGAVEGRGELLEHAADVFTRWDRRAEPADLGWNPVTQQVLSLFGRWVLPEDGFEVYTEWARYELPVSLRDLLIAPNHTQGYTLGFGWARPNRFGATRLQAESNYLEYSPTFRHRPFEPFYTSRTIPQGYTHRGQVVGAGIGPGSSSLWLALDHFGSRYNAGVYLNRIRWQAGELQRSIPADRLRVFRSFHAWDASLIGGVRAGVQLGDLWVSTELGLENRFNFLFQNPDRGYGPDGAVDVRNLQFRLTLTPVRSAPPRSPATPRASPPQSAPE